MTFDEMDVYLRSKAGATYDYPFDEVVRVYRVGGKIFALSSETHPLKINLKCDPIYALELRSLYRGITAGYHMNKKHWNTVMIEDSDVDEETIRELIDHSYDLIWKSLTRRQREMIGEG